MHGIVRVTRCETPPVVMFVMIDDPKCKDASLDPATPQINIEQYVRVSQLPKEVQEVIQSCVLSHADLKTERALLHPHTLLELEEMA